MKAAMQIKPDLRITREMRYTIYSPTSQIVGRVNGPLRMGTLHFAEVPSTRKIVCGYVALQHSSRHPAAGHVSVDIFKRKDHDAFRGAGMLAQKRGGSVEWQKVIERQASLVEQQLALYARRDSRSPRGLPYPCREKNIVRGRGKNYGASQSDQGRNTRERVDPFAGE